MAQDPHDLTHKILRQVQETLADHTARLERLEDAVDKGFMRVSKDISGLNRITRHLAADVDDIERRLETSERN